MNNQETDSHHSGGETDQKDDNLSSTKAPLHSHGESDEQVYVPNYQSCQI